MWPFQSNSASSSSSSLALQSESPTRVLTNSEAANPALNPLNPQGLKPCCACPDTKKLRDDCFLKYGSNADAGSESADKCKEIVAQHVACMRNLGFNY
ncbi:hypothetical protein T439DRAFT_322743 [Meredithblackwellia eburnea MCA 4105]